MNRLVLDDRWALGLRPEHDLLAVGIAGERDRRLVREDQDAHRLRRVVAHLVRACGSIRETDDLAGLERALAARVAQRRPAGDNDQPFLAADLVVVREALLAGRQLVEAHAELLGAEARADRGAPAAVAGPLLLALPVVAVDVEGLGHRSSPSQ